MTSKEKNKISTNRSSQRKKKNIDRSSFSLKTRAKYLAYIFPVFLGFLYAGAEQFLISNGDFTIFTPSFFVRFVIYAIIFSIVGFLLFSFCEKKKKSAVSDEASTKLTIKLFIKTWGIILICWLPVYIMLFPGVMLGDTSIQIAQYLGGDGFADWHPFLTTLIFGWFIDAFGADQAMVGVGVFIALQMLFSSALMAFLCNYIGFITKSNKFRIVAIIIFALPIAPLSFMQMNKDDLFCLFFVGFCVTFCEVWRTRGEIIKNKKFFVLLILVAIMACLTKKTGAYIVPLSLFALIFVVVGKSKKITLCAVAISVALLVHVIIPTFIFPAINVRRGPKSESIAVPIQLVAATVIAYPEDFSEADRQIINDTVAVGFDGIPGEYDAYSVDPIKGTGSPNDGSYGAFIGLFIREGLKHPWLYIKTELGLQNGWSTFTTKTGRNNTYSRATDSYAANTLTEDIEWPEASKMSQVFSSLYSSLTGIPLLNTVFYVGVWATILPILLLFVVFRRGRNIISSLLLLVPLTASFLLLYICPISTHQRYMFPIFCTGLLFLALLYGSREDATKSLGVDGKCV